MTNLCDTFACSGTSVQWCLSGAHPGGALCPKAAFPIGGGCQEAAGQDGTGQRVGPVGKFSGKFAVFSCCAPLADTALAVPRTGWPPVWPFCSAGRGAVS